MKTAFEAETLSIQQTADVLGLSHWTLRAWIRAGKISHLRLGRLLKIPRSEVDRLLTPALREIENGR